ncbi:AAA family ATPase [Corynebacterium diphtheriae]|nr:AAA family ATPase [Corynebacterium diphtheriae]CAB1047065.1 AAA family ATPase [Corynebacterium diphtheriae]
MKLISFEVSNHRSFRDDVYFDFSRPILTTNLPPKGKAWSDCLFPVAVVVGANASGKTNLLRALDFVSSAVRRSSTSWLEYDEMPRDPFRLSSAGREMPSRYAIDFVTDVVSRGKDVRYHYEFEIGPGGIVREALMQYRSSRPAMLLDRREVDGKLQLRYGNQMGSAPQLSDRELALSRARQVNHEILAPLANELANLRTYNVGDEERKQRIQWMTNGLAGGKLSFEQLQLLAKAADIGIRRVELDEREIPKDLVKLLETIEKHIKESQSNDNSSRKPEISKENRELISRSLRFIHNQADGEEVSFGLRDESDGTIAWLALAFAVLDVLRNGGLLLVDELDTSLHPHLAAEIVRLFQVPDTNRNGGQILLTTHDVTLLENDTDLQLDYRQVWFTQKNLDGSSELFSAADFGLKPKSNLAKQYREGRLGGVPLLAMPLIRDMILS